MFIITMLLFIKDISCMHLGAKKMCWKKHPPPSKIKWLFPQGGTFLCDNLLENNLYQGQIQRGGAVPTFKKTLLLFLYICILFFSFVFTNLFYFVWAPPFQNLCLDCILVCAHVFQNFWICSFKNVAHVLNSVNRLFVSLTLSFPGGGGGGEKFKKWP